MQTIDFFWGTGRRKTAVARVRVRSGEGKVLVNGREVENYFPRLIWSKSALEPLRASGMEGKLDVLVKAEGGGLTGQAGAVRLGVARALIKLNPDLRPVLKRGGFLSRDSRMVERKKYGLKGARGRRQFSKR
ncbi:30S ribosomal protein S9 [Aminithiophilus ramosus]|uniref:Small ribosomal subunit protein uS9 n=2 Tax=Synergistales TaxID=649776 RepID=A0A9Q7AP63_9BACT|nr:30S ribosomal protein S9 [Aminithiophilus ramosus]QTX32848.1 30S ribosomal protein S9 [Aminithiophilus ramosus]QVL36723.1 30S ribosomal protein S9 [Synergistota bacterium]